MSKLFIFQWNKGELLTKIVFYEQIFIAEINSARTVFQRRVFVRLRKPSVMKSAPAARTPVVSRAASAVRDTTNTILTICTA